MTIDSSWNSGRTLTVRTAPEHVSFQISASDEDPRGISVRVEDLVREITDAEIPGLTVTYEKPIVEPAHENGAVYRIETGSDQYGLAWGANDGTWDVLDPRGDATKAATSILGAFEANGYSTTGAKFIRLVPETDADL